MSHFIPRTRASIAPLFFALLAAGVAGCGGDDDYSPPPAPTPVPAPAPSPAPGNVFGLTASNRLVSFNRDAPGTVITNVAISGLQAGETMLGIDVRPADRQLYALGSTGRVYVLDPQTGAATLKSILAADPNDMTLPFTALSGTDFAVDFNPVPDRMRVVSNSGQNLRISVDTGATTTDGMTNGGGMGTSVTSAAYTNAFAGAGTTTLFDIDTGSDTLFVQDPPNDGTLKTPVSLGVDASATGGFDIDGRNNQGFAALTVAGSTGLYRINLSATANAATLVGAIGLAEPLRGLALAPIAAPTVVALTGDNRLIGFAPLTPNTPTGNVAVTGLAAGEDVLGIDVRPADGLLYALGSTGRLYTIDAATGVATFKVTLVADPTDTTAPYAGLSGTVFAVDFNPAANRLRVISNTGQNLRIDVDTGNTFTDGIINRPAGAASISAGAYTNNFAAAPSTVLMNIDILSDLLQKQDPPASGTQIDIGALGIDVSGDAGFDIAGGADGLAIAALRVGATGPYSLYRINLLTGAATPIAGTANPALSQIGGAAGPALRGIAIRL